MNWEAIGTIAEVVGAVAVVLSLIYVATQITPAALAGPGNPQGEQRAGVVATEPRAEAPEEVVTPEAERAQAEPRRPRRAQQDASERGVRHLGEGFAEGGEHGPHHVARRAPPDNPGNSVRDRLRRRLA